MIEGVSNAIASDELCLHYSGYWRRWSRVLFLNEKFKGHRVVEVNLSPINEHMKDSWEQQVLPLVIRAHSTGFDIRKHRDGAYMMGSDKLFRYVVRNKNSVVYRELRGMMQRSLPIEIVQRLLFDDFLSLIDWEKYHKNCNGGCPLGKCRLASSI